jgi:hypothetical protein
MSEKKETKIYYDSPEAAAYRSVEGWVSRNGHFWGNDEHGARLSGCTHLNCPDCGTERVANGWCDPCHAKKQRERFLAYPVGEYEFPLNLYGTDTYFWEESDLLDYLADSEYEAKEDVRLVTCVPEYPAPFEPEDYWHDILPEDGEVQDAAILEAVEALNIAIKNAKPFAYFPAKQRVELPDSIWNEIQKDQHPDLLENK